MNSLDGGSGMAAGMELDDIVLNHSFDGWVETKGCGKGRYIQY